MMCILQLALTLTLLHLHDAYDYEKDWPTTEQKATEKDVEVKAITDCKNKCPQDNALDAIPTMMQADPGKFVKADYDKFCPSATKAVKCMVNCYSKDDKWKKLDAKLADLIDYHCSPGYLKQLACYKTVHDDKKVAACMKKCETKPPAKGTPIYESLTATCKQMECQSQCEKSELLAKCKKDGKDAYATYIKKKTHLLKSTAWAHHHMNKGKRLAFSDVCDKIAY